MALTQASLSTKIETEIKALYGNPTDAARLKDFCDAVAKAVVDELQANAEVLPGSFSAPSGGGAVTGVGVIS